MTHEISSVLTKFKSPTQMQFSRLYFVALIRAMFFTLGAAPQLSWRFRSYTTAQGVSAITAH